MTPEEVQAKLADHDRWFADMRELNESTAKIAESNARSIEATTNESAERGNRIDRRMTELIEIVSSFAESTNKRLETLENQ
jgi:hypothetical protein